MKVAHVLNRFEPGGVEKWLVDLTRANVDAGQGLELDFILHSRDAGFFDADVEANGGTLRKIGLSKANPISYAWKLFRTFRQHRYDVVHTHLHHFSGWVVLIALLAKVPIRVSHSHSDGSVKHEDETMIRGGYRTLCGFLIQRCSTHRIAVSGAAAQDLFGDVQQTLVMPCGLIFDDARHEKNVELGLERRRHTLLHVGRFSDEKNHGFLLNLAQALRARELDFILYLVGDGPLRRQVETEIQRRCLAEHVSVLGKRRDVHRLMASGMDVFVFPSSYEGLGLAAIEAQFFGLLTLVSQSVPREVEVSEYLQFLPIESHAMEAWVDAIQGARQPTESQRSRCVDGILNSNLNIENNLKELMDLYQSPAV